MPDDLFALPAASAVGATAGHYVTCSRLAEKIAKEAAS